MRIEWSEYKKPNAECHYDHVTAETPFGNFLITWKGWKEFNYPTIDETPWDDCYYREYSSVEKAKEAAEQEYKEWLVREIEKYGDILNEKRRVRS